MRGERRPRSHPERAELARRQHGIVSIRQLRSLLGYSQAVVEAEVGRGELHRLYRGVYAVGHTRISRHGQCLAAVLASGPGALLSHSSAAWLWGLHSYGPLPLHATAPVRRRPRPPIVLHHARNLTQEDRALLEAIPLTALPRTLLDEAAARPRRLKRMVVRAEELRLFDLRQVDALLARSVGHPGARTLRRAIEVYRPTSFTRSGLEERFLALVIEAGLPQPRMNFVEAGFELDAYWPEERFGVELDTYATHGGHESFESDRRRHDDLVLAGIEMIRITDLRLQQEPTEVIRRLRRHLARRHREVARPADD